MWFAAATTKYKYATSPPRLEQRQPPPLPPPKLLPQTLSPPPVASAPSTRLPAYLAPALAPAVPEPAALKPTERKAAAPLSTAAMMASRQTMTTATADGGANEEEAETDQRHASRCSSTSWTENPQMTSGFFPDQTRR